MHRNADRPPSWRIITQTFWCPHVGWASACFRTSSLAACRVGCGQDPSPIDYSLTFSLHAASALGISPASTLSTIRVFFSTGIKDGPPCSDSPPGST